MSQSLNTSVKTEDFPTTDRLAADVQPRTRIRYFVIATLFIVTALNVADRAALSITGSAITTELSLSPVTLGYMFSVFAWAYVLGQIPGGFLLDRFGSYTVYGLAIFLWSTITFAQGAVGFLAPAAAISGLFILRFLLGLIEAPVYPANSRITAAWFPVQERGLATVIFNSSQYLSIAVLAPFMGFIGHHFGWKPVFMTMGVLGILASVFWRYFMRSPDTHPLVNKAELRHIKGDSTTLKTNTATGPSAHKPSFKDLGVLLKSPMMWTIYLGKYCDTSLQYFFVTWFPVYLVKYRGLNILEAGALASVPAVCGLLGAMCGGLVCDTLLKKGVSLTLARKIPLVTGMLLGSALVLCNYTDSIVMVAVFMSIAIFGKGIVAVDWTLVSDTSPPEITGMAGGMFNMFGNMSGIITPVILGYVAAYTGSFEVAMFVVAAHALTGALAFLFMGRIRRLTLREPTVAVA